MAKVIGIINQKGGVGKTTTTRELAYAVAQQNKRVLVIDLDQQANLSQYMNANNSVPSIFKALEGSVTAYEAIQTIGNLSLIRGSEELSKADSTFNDADDFYRLQDVIEALSNDFDYIFIDNGPSRNTLHTMLYMAADYLVVPTEADDGSVAGIDKIKEDLAKFREKRKMSHAKIAMLILTKYENTIAHRDIKNKLDEISDEDVDHPIVTTVRKSIVATDSKTFRQSIQEYDHNSTTADDYMTVAKILMREVA